MDECTRPLPAAAANSASTGSQTRSESGGAVPAPIDPLLSRPTPQGPPGLGPSSNGIDDSVKGSGASSVPLMSPGLPLTPIPIGMPAVLAVDPASASMFPATSGIPATGILRSGSQGLSPSASMRSFSMQAGLVSAPRRQVAMNAFASPLPHRNVASASKGAWGTTLSSPAYSRPVASAVSEFGAPFVAPSHFTPPPPPPAHGAVTATPSRDCNALRLSSVPTQHQVSGNQFPPLTALPQAAVTLPEGGDVFEAAATTQLPAFDIPLGVPVGLDGHAAQWRESPAATDGRSSGSASLFERGFKQPSTSSGVFSAMGAAVAEAVRTVGRAVGMGPTATTVVGPSRPTTAVANRLAQALLSSTSTTVLLEPSVSQLLRFTLDDYNDANIAAARDGRGNLAFEKEVDEMVSVARVALRLVVDDATAAATGGGRACPAAVLVLLPLTLRIVQYSWSRHNQRSTSEMTYLVRETAAAWTGTLFGPAGHPGASPANALRNGAAAVLSIAAADGGQHPLCAYLRDAIAELTAVGGSRLASAWREQWTHASNASFLLLLQLTQAMLEPGCAVGGNSSAFGVNPLPDPLRRVWGIPDVNAPPHLQKPYAGAWLVRVGRMATGLKDRPSPARLLEVMVAVSDAGRWGLPATAVLRTLLDAGADAARAIGDAARDGAGHATTGLAAEQRTLAAARFAGELLLSPAAVSLLRTGYDGAAQGLDSLVATAADAVGDKEVADALGKLAAMLSEANSVDAKKLAVRVQGAFVDMLVRAAAALGNRHHHHQQQQQQVRDSRLSTCLEAFQDAACTTSLSRQEWGATLRDRLGGGSAGGLLAVHHASDSLLRQLEPAVVARLPLTASGRAGAATDISSGAAVAARYLRLYVEARAREPVLPLRTEAWGDRLATALAPLLDAHCAAPPSMVAPPDAAAGAATATRAFMVPLLEALRGLLQAAASGEVLAFQHTAPVVLGFCLRAPAFCRTAAAGIGVWWSSDAARAAALDVLEDRAYPLPRPADCACILLSNLICDALMRAERAHAAVAAVGGAPVLPPPYLALAAAYGAAVGSLVRGTAAVAAGTRAALDSRLDVVMRACLPLQYFPGITDAALPLAVPVAALLRATLNDCAGYLGHADSRFAPPARLEAFSGNALLYSIARPTQRQATPLLRLFAGSCADDPAAAADGTDAAAVLPALRAVAAAVYRALVDVSTDRLTRTELEGLRRPGAAERIRKVAAPLQPFMQMQSDENVDMYLESLGAKSLSRMAAEFANIDDQRPVVAATLGFLRSRRLLSPDAVELPPRGQPTDVLSDLSSAFNGALRHISADPATRGALMAFVGRGSAIFSARFDAEREAAPVLATTNPGSVTPLTCPAAVRLLVSRVLWGDKAGDGGGDAPRRGLPDQVSAAGAGSTATTGVGLYSLVVAGDVCIRDLLRHVDAGMAHSAVSEFQIVTDFFSASGNAVATGREMPRSARQRLAAALELVRFARDLPLAIQALRDLQLLEPAQVAALAALPIVADTLQNVQLLTMAAAPGVLQDVQRQLASPSLGAASGDAWAGGVAGTTAGLDTATLAVLAALPSNRPAYDLLRAHDVGADLGAGFREKLDLARERAAANPLSLALLLRLEPLRATLWPLYKERFRSLQALMARLHERLLAVPRGAAGFPGDVQPPQQQDALAAEVHQLEVAASIVVGDLRAVSNNMVAVVLFFNSRGGTSPDEILAVARAFVETGCFYSSLSVPPALSFTFRAGGATEELAQDLLLDQVQGAELSESSCDEAQREVLRAFVRSFWLAQDVHSVRQRLQLAGHPDHQSDKRVALADSTDAVALEAARDGLVGTLCEWDAQVAAANTTMPQLRMLGGRTRLCFIQALRRLKSPPGAVATGGAAATATAPIPQAADAIASLLPYVLLSSNPKAVESRNEMQAAIPTALAAALREHPGDDDGSASAVVGLRRVCRLLQGIFDEVRIDVMPEPGVARQHMMGRSPEDCYLTAAEAQFRNVTAGPMLPGQVLVGEPETSVRAVHEWLELLSTPFVADTMVAIEVNRLSGAAREALLQGILHVVPEAEATLLFTDGGGADSFLHLPLAMREAHTWGAEECRANHRMIVAMDGDAPVVECFAVVTGSAGVGKGRLIQQELSRANVPPARTLTVAVHEGLSIAAVASRYVKMVAAAVAAAADAAAMLLPADAVLERPRVGIHIDVSATGASLGGLSRVLHGLLTLCMWLDEASGEAVSLTPGIAHYVYLELPAIAAIMPGDPAAPAGRTEWPAPAIAAAPDAPQAATALAHPFLRELGPARCAALVPGGRGVLRFLSGPAPLPWVVDDDARDAAAILEWHYENSEAADVPVRPSPPPAAAAAAAAVVVGGAAADPPPPPPVWPAGMTDDAVRALLQRCWREDGLLGEPAVTRAAHLRLLGQNARYLQRLQRELTRQRAINWRALAVGDFVPQSRYELRAWVDAEAPMLRAGVPFEYASGDRVPRFFLRVFRFMRTEAARLARRFPMIPTEPAPGQESRLVVTPLLTPSLMDFRLLVTGARIDEDGEGRVDGLPRSLTLRVPSRLEDGDTLAEVRAAVGPVFQITNTLEKLLHAAGFVLTPDTLGKLLDLHGQRCAQRSLILEGGTGVGKSFQLQLYSLIVNANRGLFIDMAAHVSGVLSEVAKERAHLPAYAHLIVGGRTPQAPVMTASATGRWPRWCVGGRTIVTVATAGWTRRRIITEVAEVLRVDVTQKEVLMAALVAHFSDELRHYPLQLAAANATVRGLLCGGYPLEGLPAAVKGAARRTSAEVRLLLSAAATAEEVAAVADGHCFDDVEEPLRLAQVVAAATAVTAASSAAAAAAAEPLSPAEGYVIPLDHFTAFVAGLLDTKPTVLFRRVLAHKDLTAIVWRTQMAALRRDALASPQALLCVFIDESNTAGALGCVCEAFIRHSVDGEALPANIFFVGAINPPGVLDGDDSAINYTRLADAATPSHETTSAGSSAKTRAPDAGNWPRQPRPRIQAFNVKHLPPSAQVLVSPYGALTPAAERAFVYAYLTQGAVKLHDGTCTSPFVKHALRAILAAQALVRGYHIFRVDVSIRDLQRAVDVFHFLCQQRTPTRREPVTNKPDDSSAINPFLPDASGTVRLWQALIAAVSVVYYLRLPGTVRGSAVAAAASADNKRHDFSSKFTRDAALPTYVAFDATRAAAFAHLASFLRPSLPPGIADTAAMQENVYAILVAVTAGVPLLITSPPGTGKTLSFNITADVLKGESVQQGPRAPHVLFQLMRALTVLHYQCSELSTAGEIQSLYVRAYERADQMERSAPGKHTVCVFLDEAGLPEEQKEALKALHDVLDKPRGVPSVLLSNHTLDTANTNRCIQVLQTEVSEDDMTQLAVGLLLEGRDQAAWCNRGGTRARTLSPFINGLVSAAKALKGMHFVPAWFHTRDFVYLLRHLRRDMDHAGARGTFTVGMLMAALRRNFQTMDPVEFSILATRFMEECELVGTPGTDDVSPYPLRSLRLSLEDKHADPSAAPFRHTMLVDPTGSQSAVDLAFSLGLLSRDPRATTVVALSDFSSDAAYAGRLTEALKSVKDAAESGATLLLINCDPIYSSLFDLFNRNYRSAPGPGGTTSYFTNIAVGAFSRVVCVHPAFRVVVHVPAASLARTSLPFLNRFAKFSLSAAYALEDRLGAVALHPPACLQELGPAETVVTLFRALCASVEHFAEFIGVSAFYGFAARETIPALVLRTLDDAAATSGGPFRPRLALHAASSAQVSRVLAAAIANEAVALDASSICGSSDETIAADVPLYRRVRGLVRGLNFQLLQQARPEAVFAASVRLPKPYLEEYLVYQEHFSAANLIRSLVAQQWTATAAMSPPASVPFEAPTPAIAAAAPAESGVVSNGIGAPLVAGDAGSDVNLIVAPVAAPAEAAPAAIAAAGRKVIIFTRKDGALGQLRGDSGFASRLLGVPAFVSEGSLPLRTAFDTAAAASAGAAVGAASMSATAAGKGGWMAVLPLESCPTAGACKARLREFFAAAVNGTPSALLLLVDMASCTQSQVNVARNEVDACLDALAQRHVDVDATATTAAATALTSAPNVRRAVPPLVVMLLHTPGEFLVLQPCYQPLALSGWDSIFVDTLGADDMVVTEEESVGGASAAATLDVYSPDEPRTWLAIAFGLTAGLPFAKELRDRHANAALQHALQALNFDARVAPGELGALGVVKAADIYCGGPDAPRRVAQLLGDRPYLLHALQEQFVLVWAAMLQSITRAACLRLARGETVRGLLSALRSGQDWLLRDYFKRLVRVTLAADWGLEALAKLPEGVLPTVSVTAATDTEEAPGWVLARLSVSILAAVPPPLPQDILDVAPAGGNELLRVQCQTAGHAPALPLYFPLMDQLSGFVHTAVAAASNRGADRCTVLARVGAALVAAAAEGPHSAALRDAVAAINAHSTVWRTWLRCFLTSHVGIAEHPSNTGYLRPHEFDAVTDIAARIVAAEAATSAASSTVACDGRSVLLAMLMREDLRAALLPVARELRRFGAVVPVADVSLIRAMCTEAAAAAADASPASTLARRLLVSGIGCLYRQVVVAGAATGTAPSPELCALVRSQSHRCGGPLYTAAAASALLAPRQLLQAVAIVGATAALRHVPVMLPRPSAAVSAFAGGATTALDVYNALAALTADPDLLDEAEYGTAEADGDGAPLSPAPPAGASSSLPLRGVLVLLENAGAGGWVAPAFVEVMLRWALSARAGGAADLRALPASALATLFAGLLAAAPATGSAAAVIARLPERARVSLAAHLLRTGVDGPASAALGAALATVLPAPQRAAAVTVPVAVTAARTAWVAALMRTAATGSEAVPLLQWAPAVAAAAAPVVVSSPAAVALAALQAADASAGAAGDLAALVASYPPLAGRRAPGATLPALQAAVAAQVAVDCAIAMLLRGIQAGPVQLQPAPAAGALVAGIIAEAPSLWGPYLLARVARESDVALVELLASQPTLTALGLAQWYVPDMATAAAAVPVLAGQDALVRAAALQEAEAARFDRLTRARSALIRAGAVVMVAQQRLSPPPRAADLLCRAAVDAERAGDASTRTVGLLVSTLTHPALPFMAHAPAVAALYAFATQHFAYRFTAPEARETLLDDAIDELPPGPRANGRQCVAAFLRAWAALRARFGAYNAFQCARGLPIPLFTARGGEKPLAVADVVSLPRDDGRVADARNEECAPFQMLRDLLLGDGDRPLFGHNFALRQECVAAARADTGAGGLNAGFTAMLGAAGVLDMLEVPRVVDTLPLITGMAPGASLDALTAPPASEQADPAAYATRLAEARWEHDRALLETLSATLRFVEDAADGDPAPPPPRPANLDVRAMQQRLDAQLRHKNRIVEEVFNIRCPRAGCRMAFVDYTGCDALTCHRADCGCGFCALCLLDCGTNAHAHVQAANHHRDNSGYYGGMVKFRRWHDERVRRELPLAIIAVDETTEFRLQLLELLRVPLRELTSINCDELRAEIERAPARAPLPRPANEGPPMPATPLAAGHYEVDVRAIADFLLPSHLADRPLLTLTALFQPLPLRQGAEEAALQEGAVMTALRELRDQAATDAAMEEADEETAAAAVSSATHSASPAAGGAVTVPATQSGEDNHTLQHPRQQHSALLASVPADDHGACGRLRRTAAALGNAFSAVGGLAAMTPIQARRLELQVKSFTEADRDALVDDLLLICTAAIERGPSPEARLADLIADTRVPAARGAFSAAFETDPVKSLCVGHLADLAVRVVEIVPNAAFSTNGTLDVPPTPTVMHSLLGLELSLTSRGRAECQAAAAALQALFAELRRSSTESVLMADAKRPLRDFLSLDVAQTAALGTASRAALDSGVLAQNRGELMRWISRVVGALQQKEAAGTEDDSPPSLPLLQQKQQLQSLITRGVGAGTIGSGHVSQPEPRGAVSPTAAPSRRAARKHPAVYLEQLPHLSTCWTSEQVPELRALEPDADVTSPSPQPASAAPQTGIASALGTTNMLDVLRDEREQQRAAAVHRYFNEIVSQQLELRCPRCHAVFLDYNNCDALTCHRADCGCAFCALCLQDCGADAHAHVEAADHHGDGSRLFGGLDKFNAYHRLARERSVRAVLCALPAPLSLRLRVLESLSPNLTLIGIGTDCIRDAVLAAPAPPEEEEVAASAQQLISQSSQRQQQPPASVGQQPQHSSTETQSVPTADAAATPMPISAPLQLVMASRPTLSFAGLLPALPPLAQARGVEQFAAERRTTPEAVQLLVNAKVLTMTVKNRFAKAAIKVCDVERNEDTAATFYAEKLELVVNVGANLHASPAEAHALLLHAAETAAAVSSSAAAGNNTTMAFATPFYMAGQLVVLREPALEVCRTFTTLTALVACGALRVALVDAERLARDRIFQHCEFLPVPPLPLPTPPAIEVLQSAGVPAATADTEVLQSAGAPSTAGIATGVPAAAAEAADVTEGAAPPLCIFPTSLVDAALVALAAALVPVRALVASLLAEAEPGSGAAAAAAAEPGLFDAEAADAAVRAAVFTCSYGGVEHALTVDAPHAREVVRTFLPRTLPELAAEAAMPPDTLLALAASGVIPLRPVPALGPDAYAVASVDVPAVAAFLRLDGGFVPLQPLLQAIVTASVGGGDDSEPPSVVQLDEFEASVLLRAAAAVGGCFPTCIGGVPALLRAAAEGGGPQMATLHRSLYETLTVQLDPADIDAQAIAARVGVAEEDVEALVAAGALPPLSQLRAGNVDATVAAVATALRPLEEDFGGVEASDEVVAVLRSAGLVAVWVAVRSQQQRVLCYFAPQNARVGATFDATAETE